MGKKAKKKARAPTKENRTTSLSKKVSEQPNQSEEVAVPVIEVKEKQACVHFDKGLNLDKVLDKIKSSRQIKCEECKEGVHAKRGAKAKSNKGKKSSSSSSTEPKSEKKAIWVCLECGCYVCGGVGLPTGSQSHVVRHIRLTRHRLVIQWENPQLRWCFSCNSLLPVENSEKIDLLSEVVKSIKERSLKTISDTEEQCSGSGSIISDMKLEGTVSVTSGIEVRDGYVVRGLVNLGNTCFFNSIMQNLLSLDQLRDHFLKEDDVVVSGGPLASSLKKLFAETKPEAGSKSVVNPRAFFGYFCSKAPQFRGYDQHDSHELLRCLLDSLSTEESALRKKRGGNEKESTLIESVFGGEISSIVSCIECGHSSKVFEPFLDLSLPIPFKKTPPKKPQTVSRAKKAKLPPKRVSKGGSKVSKVSKTVSTKALSELNSPVKALVSKADSDTANGPVLETPSVITVENKPDSESAIQSDTVFNNFWLDIGPETSGDKTNLDTQKNIVIDNHTLESDTEKLMRDNGGCEKAETILDEKGVQSDEFTAASGVSVEINQDSCVDGDNSGLGECSSSSVNPWDEEELPLVVTESQVLYMPYKTVEGEASSSFVDLGGLFDEPEVSTEGPVFGPPSKAEASSSSGVGFIVFSSESDPEEIDDSESPVSVERCLAHFTKPEILSDDNAWNCENCSKKLKLQRLREKRKAKKDDTSNGEIENGVMSSNSANDSESEEDSVKLVTVKRDATKRVLINKAPPVLTIHLKRFSQDTRGRLSKLSGHVTFKEFIDLRQYMDSRRSGEEDLPVYRLAGLVEHSGTMRGGHYVACVRGGERVKGTESSTVWYNVSDAYVRQVSLEKVLHSEAYILFYERISASQD